jgi:chemotaxis regulatin CheY-phosphate phosphatase CheZ
MTNSPPIIAFELGVGEFRIVTPEAVYLIKVCPDLVEATRPGEAPGEVGNQAGIQVQSRQAEVANTFFQELSQELFAKVGRLARQLSVSVEELPSEMPAKSLDDTGQQLEDAKGQLEEIIDITEKASMSIMDSADEIQDNLNQLRNNMDILNGLDFMAEAAVQAGRDQDQTPASPAPAAGSALLVKVTEMGALLVRLLQDGPGEDAPPAAPPAAPAPPPAAPAAEKVVHFNVEAVFQTLYELCTNEAVKEHIRLMRESLAKAFDSLGISGKLTELSGTVPVDDGFYSFPIPAVLKIIYGATASEEFRSVLKKMNQTAASIFLDSVLPVEGQVMEIDPGGEAQPEAAPAAPAPAAPVQAAPVPAGTVPPEYQTLRALTAELDALVRSGSALPGGGGDGDGLYTHILTHDRDALVQIVSQANELIHKTGRHLNRILETLSFQDLSGQRIKKVVALMGDIQAQLLSILVSVDTKMKVHEASKDQEVDPEKTEKMAQDEVDRAVEKR